ncbi:MAG: enoyl-CoA hydratase-related protein, partial [Candidatus Latescibacterota bacterium]|nr:enoyl-CoA hydratase-related protein [Candidatus Latescibacterota bacterium]
AVLAYAAEHAAEMADDFVQIDQAMRWGFNWDLGPFELWDFLGVGEVVNALAAKQQPVPDLVARLIDAGEERFYGDATGSTNAFPPASLKRESQQQVAGGFELLDPDRAAWSNEGAYLVELDADIGALVFSGKMNALGPAALAAVHHVVDQAPFAGLVLCGAGALFSVGADLKYVAGLVKAEDWPGLDAFVANFQKAVQALRQAPFPVVAAVRGLALGGGCEFSLGADARVAAAELRMGLVETKVGLIPGSGGCMELARRKADAIEIAFATIFAGQFSDNAFQAQAWGLLGSEDEILLGEDLLLKRAAAKARELLASGYAGGEVGSVPVTGDQGLELLHRDIEDRLANGLISAHDAVVGRGLARVLAGGGGAARELAASAMLDLDREVFLELCATESTRQRIDHMLKTGKPLKN